LISFNAQGAPDRVILAWSTASEIDNYMFLIRRADDPDGEFKLIATVPSQFTNGNTNYALSDFDVQSGVTYYYTLADVSLSGVEVIHPIVASATPGPAGDFILAQNYPNPFNAGTTIRFTLPYPAKVRLEVFDASGSHVKVLVDEQQSAGRHEALWDGKSYDGRLAVSGIYIYRLQAGDMISTGKMVLVK
jgi:hypothetical protein